MSQTIGSFIVVKRKANEYEVRGGKRLKLIGSYTTKPNEDDIVERFGQNILGQKRLIIQDLDSSEFRQFISELPKKKSKIQKNEDTKDENCNPLLELNLNAEDFITADYSEQESPVQITCNGEQMLRLSNEKTSESGYESDGCVYDVYGFHEDCPLDFGSLKKNKEETLYDDDSDENDENWRGNDYPDEDEISDDDFRSTTSDNSTSYQDVGSEIELNDSELDDFDKLCLDHSDDDMRYGSCSDSD